MPFCIFKIMKKFMQVAVEIASRRKKNFEILLSIDKDICKIQCHADVAPSEISIVDCCQWIWNKMQKKKKCSPGHKCHQYSLKFFHDFTCTIECLKPKFSLQYPTIHQNTKTVSFSVIGSSDTNLLIET